MCKEQQKNSERTDLLAKFDVIDKVSHRFGIKWV